MRDIITVGGLLLVAVGLWLVHPGLALVFGGIVTLWLAYRSLIK